MIKREKDGRLLRNYTSVYSDLIWERNCTSLLSDPIKLYFASLWFDGDQPHALSFLGSSESFEAIITLKVLSYFQKRGSTECVFLLLSGTQLVCVGLEQILSPERRRHCNHVQAAKDVGSSEVVCMREFFSTL